MSVRVYYTKSFNPDLQINNGFHTIDSNAGWIEYLQQWYQLVYTTDIGHHNYQNWTSALKQNLINFYLKNNDARFLGFLKKLAYIRTEQPFDIPIFVAKNNYEDTITCGNTRFISQVLCGQPSNNIPTIFQLPKNFDISKLTNPMVITSTRQVEEKILLNKNYSIHFTQTDPPCVSSSILSETQFDTADLSDYVQSGNTILEFWKKFQTNNRIKIIVHAQEKTRSLIHFNANCWEVEFAELDPVDFSYYPHLDKLKTKRDNQLHLYVYNIQESFDLGFLIPWIESGSCWYHTQNKKVHLLDTTRGKGSDERPIKMIGNFVK
jgi:hypothetical protein